MPARHFAALVERLHPGVSVRHLTEAAGLRENAISYYLKPSTTIVRIPPAPTVNELARALSCEPWEVVQAFAKDVDLPLGIGVFTEEDQELLRLARRLPPDRRRILNRIVIALSVEVEPALEP